MYDGKKKMQYWLNKVLMIGFNYKLTLFQKKAKAFKDTDRYHNQSIGLQRRHPTWLESLPSPQKSQRNRNVYLTNGIAFAVFRIFRISAYFFLDKTKTLG
jgi:hypothetical protein